MQAPSEALVREEHEIGDPPLMSQQVCLCIAFFVCLCIASLIWCLKRPKSVTHLFPPNVHVYLLTLAYIFFLCSLIVSKWCLKITQSGSMLVRHCDPPLLTHVQ